MLLQLFYRLTKVNTVVCSNFSLRKFPNTFSKFAVLLKKTILNRGCTMILKNYMDIYPLNSRCF